MELPNEALFCRGERGQGVEEFEIWYQHEDGEFRECDDSEECLTKHIALAEDAPAFVRLWDYMDLLMDYDTLLAEYIELKNELE